MGGGVAGTVRWEEIDREGFRALVAKCQELEGRVQELEGCMASLRCALAGAASQLEWGGAARRVVVEELGSGWQVERAG